jgi:hypothetical protein
MTGRRRTHRGRRVSVFSGAAGHRSRAPTAGDHRTAGFVTRIRSMLPTVSAVSCASSSLMLPLGRSDCNPMAKFAVLSHSPRGRVNTRLVMPADRLPPESPASSDFRCAHATARQRSSVSHTRQADHRRRWAASCPIRERRAEPAPGSGRFPLREPYPIGGGPGGNTPGPPIGRYRCIREGRDHRRIPPGGAGFSPCTRGRKLNRKPWPG